MPFSIFVPSQSLPHFSVCFALSLDSSYKLAYGPRPGPVYSGSPYHKPLFVFQ